MMDAWDYTFSELIKQVSVHMAERGELLSRLRDQYLVWLRQLIDSNRQLLLRVEQEETKESKEKNVQEERLDELAQRIRTLEHKNVALAREVGWLRTGAKERRISLRKEGKECGGKVADLQEAASVLRMVQARYLQCS